MIQNTSSISKAWGKGKARQTGWIILKVQKVGRKRWTTIKMRRCEKKIVMNRIRFHGRNCWWKRDTCSHTFCHHPQGQKRLYTSLAYAKEGGPCIQKEPRLKVCMTLLLQNVKVLWNNIKDTQQCFRCNTSPVFFFNQGIRSLFWSPTPTNFGSHDNITLLLPEAIYEWIGLLPFLTLCHIKFHFNTRRTCKTQNVFVTMLNIF